MLVLIVGIILILGGVVIAFQKKSYVIPIVMMISGIILLTLLFINTLSQTKKINLSKDTFEQISTIDWHDKEQLLKVGFEEHDTELTLIDTTGDLTYRIIIRKTQDIPNDTQQYGNVLYKCKESKIGILDIRRIWIKDIPVVRRYLIYVDGIEIWMLEDNTENSPYLFEEAIDIIFKKLESIS